MNTQQHRRFHLPFTTVSNRPGEQQQQQQQQQRGITRSFFDGIRNLRTLKTASGMCGSCK
jgi:hypothetical protein